MYKCMYVCMYVYVNVHIYIYVYIRMDHHLSEVTVHHIMGEVRDACVYIFVCRCGYICMYM
jgi:hypothetical protein